MSGRLQKYFIAALYAVGIGISRITGVGCLWRKLFGIPCPGCGYSRAIVSAICMDLSTAVGYHQLFWTFPVLVLFFIKDGRVFRNDRINVAAITLIAVMFAVTWIIRLYFGVFPD